MKRGMRHAIEPGYCECGCGEQTKPAPWNDAKRGLVKGQPQRFVQGHHQYLSREEFAVDPVTGCWDWLRARQPNGYGKIRNEYAHRVYYERYVGPIPEGLTIDHLCRNRACVNPEHLEAVSIAENSRRGCRAKLDQAMAEEIRRSDRPALELAETFGVTRNTIYKVRRGERWAA